MRMCVVHTRFSFLIWLHVLCIFLIRQRVNCQQVIWIIGLILSCFDRSAGHCAAVRLQPAQSERAGLQHAPPDPRLYMGALPGPQAPRPGRPRKKQSVALFFIVSFLLGVDVFRSQIHVFWMFTALFPRLNLRIFSHADCLAGPARDGV